MTGVPLWNWMQKVLNVRSMVDVGCGRGISTKWFLDHGSEVLCVEGSHDAVEQSLLPRSVIVEHDFSRGPWWPNATYDLAWSVEFLEHVGRHYAQNYMPIFRRSALAFVTHSTWGGWHHVEVHNEWWWKARFAAQGFQYSPELTKAARAQARKKPPGVPSAYGQHLWLHLLVFINAEIARLPQHAHLVGGPGCGEANPARGPHFLCKGEDAMPDQYLPVNRKISPFDEKGWDLVNLPLPRKFKGGRRNLRAVVDGEEEEEEEAQAEEERGVRRRRRRRRHRRLRNLRQSGNETGAARRMLLSYREEA